MRPENKNTFRISIKVTVIARDLLVLDEACLPEVLLALLLLLGVVVGDVGGVAPLVVAVVAGDHLLVLDLLDHLQLVHAPLPVPVGLDSRHVVEGDAQLALLALPGVSDNVLNTSLSLTMIPMMIPSMILFMMSVLLLPLLVLIEGKGVDQTLGISIILTMDNFHQQ